MVYEETIPNNQRTIKTTEIVQSILCSTLSAIYITNYQQWGRFLRPPHYCIGSDAFQNLSIGGESDQNFHLPEIKLYLTKATLRIAVKPSVSMRIRYKPLIKRVAFQVIEKLPALISRSTSVATLRPS